MQGIYNRIWILWIIYTIIYYIWRRIYIFLVQLYHRNLDEIWADDFYVFLYGF